MDTIYYSKSTGGFYFKDIHGERIPKDAVEISEEYHTELFEGQAKGKQIVGDDKGYPVLVEPPPPSKEEMAEMNKLSRQAAFKEEADPLFFQYQRGEATKEEWLSKVEEIRKRFPTK